MEQEIDLRQYIMVVVRQWYWAVGLALVAAVATYTVGSMEPTTYKATALVAITNPAYQVQLNTRVENILPDLRLLSRSYPTVALSSDLLESVAEAAKSGPANYSEEQVASAIYSAEALTDPSLIELKVVSTDAELAAVLADVWATKFVAQIDSLYGQSDTLPALEAQLAEAKAVVEEADEVLAAYRRDYGMAVVDSMSTMASASTAGGGRTRDVGIFRRLEAETDRLMDYQGRALRTAQLLDEARAVQATISPQTSPAILAGLFADLVAMGQAYNVLAPVQINVNDLDPAAAAAALVGALEARLASTNTTVETLEKETSSLQAQVAIKQQELDQLLRGWQLAQDTYLAIASRVQDVQLQEHRSIARLVSHAAVPEVPVASRRSFTSVVIAACAGFLAGVFGLLVVDFWRQPVGVAAVAEDVASPPARQRSL
jgi:uncharacterized protein involved in exopolysaccharide biosynthesis